jgi:hypothetical protein
MRPRWGKANEEETGMTEPPKRRVLDPSRVRPASRAELERIYGPHGLSIYSPVRPSRTSTDEREAEEQPPKPQDGERGTDE